MRPTVFLDRDGVINVDTGYPHQASDFRFIDGAPEAIGYLNKLGYLVIVVSNQSGVAKGLFQEKDVDIFNAHIQLELKLRSAYIDKFYFCPFHPDALIDQYRHDHYDRKPSPGMIERAIVEFDVDREKSILIGDRDTDILAAEAANIPGYFFPGGNLYDFVRTIF